MLEITILKERHTGIDEARKLRPFVENCDAYGVESAGTSIFEAALIETNWKAALQQPSLTAFKKELHHSYGYGRADPEVIEYNVQRDEYLFRNQRPLYVIERYADEDIIDLNATNLETFHAQQEAASHLLSGDVEKFVPLAKNAFEKLWRYCRMRDAAMSQGLIPAEGYLRAMYPALNKKKNIRLTMGVGALHCPEEHLRLPHTVVVLCSVDGANTESIDYRMRKIWGETGRIDTDNILAYGAAFLEQRGKSPHPIMGQALEQYKLRHAA